MAFGGLLPTLEFFNIRFADPAGGMRASGAVLSRDGRPFDMKAFHRGACGKVALRLNKVAE